jgi:glycosyltransferase involved in cell wall biosynthesis
MQQRLGVLDFNPIQYHVPLYQLLARRGNVELDVMYLTDQCLRPVIDPMFGVSVFWDIDLLSNYSYQFLTTSDFPQKPAHQARTLKRWILSQNAVVVYGYSNPWMLLAIAICRTYRIPYLMRGDSRPENNSVGLRRIARNAFLRRVIHGSSSCLSIGHLNEAFYRENGAQNIIFAPYSVDNERFARPPQITRSEILARWELEQNRPVIVFCGKLYPGKRPLDLVAAVRSLQHPVSVFFVGDGELNGQVSDSLTRSQGVVTGFVNQSELPSYYHAADILVLPSEAEKWGLVVNEAMAAGVLPVVSDRVGAAPDLVQGLGEIFPCGDIGSLAGALSRALSRVRDPQIRDTVRKHAARYSLDRTALGFEEAALALSDRKRPSKQKFDGYANNA